MPVPALAALASGLNGAPRVRQLAAMQGALAPRAPDPVAPANRTGMPDRLKSGIEAVSGLSMDAVRVHYESARPAQLNALAFAQGSEIHLAPGQAHHLPHEAWHVVQQAQGRVRATAQLRAGVPVNDDPALEREADEKGREALEAGMAPMAASPALERREPLQAVAQRQLDAVYGGAVTAAVDAKMAIVVTTLNRMGLAVVPAVEVVIGINEDPDHVHRNPADTTRVQHPAYEAVRINIERWFVEMSSVGEIIGMIAHELGVHSLANIEMTGGERGAEAAAAGAPYNAMIAGAGRPLAPLGAPGDRRQPDHVNVAKFTPAPVMVPMPRMEKYIQTMLRLGDAIQNAPGGGEYANAGAKLAAQQDMFQTFLFDLARIIATDDGATWAVAIGAGDIAAVFNWLHNYLINRYGGAHGWLAQMVIGNATATSLITMLGGKVARALWAQRSAMMWQGVNALRTTAAAGLRWVGLG